MKPILNEEILFSFLYNIFSEEQAEATKQDPNMKILACLFHSEDFDSYLINTNIDLGKNKKKRLKIINEFIKKHSKSQLVWLEKEDLESLNNYYIFRM